MALGAPPPAFADTSQAALAAYVRARAADAGGDPAQASAGYAQALAVVDADPVVAVRAYRAAIDAGDYPLANRARQVLERAGVAPGDAALLALAEAVVDDDDPAIQAAIRRLATGSLGFLAKPLAAWRLAARGDARAPEALADGDGDALARGFATENRVLLLIAQRRAEAGIAQLRALGTPASPIAELRQDAADLLVLAGRADLVPAIDVTPPAAAPLKVAAAGQRPIAGHSLLAFGTARLLSRLATTIDGFDGARRDPAIARAALRIDPDDDRARIALAGALAVDRGGDAALAVLDGVARDSRYFRRAQARRADILAMAGKHEAALAIAASLAAGSSASAADLRRYAAALRSADRPAEAALIYASLVDNDRSGADWALRLLLGEAQEHSGDWQSARANYEKAATLAPDRAVALNYLGYALVEHDDNLPRAQILLEQAVALAPQDFSILDSLAWAYFKQADVARAVPLLERAARAQPDNAVITEHLGDAYWQAGRRYEARYAWRAASIDAGPEDTLRLAAKIDDGPQAR